MTIRLFDGEEHNTSKGAAEKVLFTAQLALFLAALFLFVYSFKIQDFTLKIRFLLVYSLIMLLTLVGICRYGFVPFDNSLNGQLPLTEYFLIYLLYFSMLFNMTNDTIKIAFGQITK